MRALGLAAVLAAVVTPAFAGGLTATTEGYTYFNRPGADFAAHDADIVACRKIAGRLHQPPRQVTTVVTSGAGALGAVIGMAIVQAVIDTNAHPINVENCMVARGWRVVAVEKDEGVALAALDRKAKVAALTPWIGAQTPHGTIERVFRNELADYPAAGMFFPGVTPGKAALSAEAAAKPEVRTAQGPAPSAPDMPRSAHPPKALKAEDLGGVPAKSALIVVDILGSGNISLGFERVGPDVDTPAWIDGQPASFVVEQSRTAFASATGASGQIRAFAVPPGRWRLAWVAGGSSAVSFCLGSPAFDVAIGQVVYAGAFDPNALGHPDLSLEPARAVFPSLSGLADKVQAATYVNGAEGQCGGTYAYALEMPGQAFVDGYGWGSQGVGPRLTAPPASAGSPDTAQATAAAPAATAGAAAQAAPPAPQAPSTAPAAPTSSQPPPAAGTGPTPPAHA